MTSTSINAPSLGKALIATQVLAGYGARNSLRYASFIAA